MFPDLPRTVAAGTWPMRSAWLWALLSAGFVGLFFARLPTVSASENFRFADWGANLTVQVLVEQGDRPTVDFFYPYGLLPLLFGRVWFGLFGKTPAAYLAAVVLSHVLAAWGMARLASSVRVGWAGVALLICAIPYALPSTQPSLSHAFETVFLCLALAEQARGRRNLALALATAAALTKPSMAYVYGAILLALIAWDARRQPSGWLRFATRQLRPALATAVGLSLLLVLVFGWRPWAGSVLPLQVAALYKDANYGFFFGGGRNFWLPPNAGLRHYLGTQLGFWLASTFSLILGGVLVVTRWARGGVANGWRHPRSEPLQTEEIIGTCAALHISFLCLFFGGEVSWLYYSYLLVLGTSALAGLGGRWSIVVAILAVLALVADRTIPREVASAWRGGSFSSEAHNLWVTPEREAEWREVLRRIEAEGRPTALLSMAGAAPILYPDHFLPSVNLFLLPGMQDTIDIYRKAEQIRTAELVLVPTASTQALGVYEFLLGCPEIRAALGTEKPVWRGTYYEIYQRPSPASRPLGLGSEGTLGP